MGNMIIIVFENKSKYSNSIILFNSTLNHHREFTKILELHIEMLIESNIIEHKIFTEI